MKPLEELKSHEDRKELRDLLIDGSKSEYGIKVREIMQDQIDSFTKEIEEVQKKALSSAWGGSDMEMQQLQQLSIRARILETVRNEYTQAMERVTPTEAPTEK